MIERMRKEAHFTLTGGGKSTDDPDQVTDEALAPTDRSTRHR
jgi:hypothetical protein